MEAACDSLQRDRTQPGVRSQSELGNLATFFFFFMIVSVLSACI